MNIVDIIRKKRNGGELTKEEIEYFAFSAADGSVPDYQLSALLMAIWIKGLSEKETLELTDAMARSGDIADLSGIDGVKCDKHSTGGVGDKTTLIVAPIVASCGVKIAKMSGRGLGHTGGTVDKLESVPGMRTAFEADEFTEIVNRCGLCVAGQSGRLCPADKKLYALRDVTATVDNMALIASSIMSKKLAGGADCIVLDVKCGSGAFMKDKDSAIELANKMVNIGNGAGKKTAALITDMDSPLGNCVGNSLEIIEAVETLKGNGPEDLTELSVILSAKMLELSGKGTFEECKKLAESKIADGSALDKLAEMVALQGGDKHYIYDTSLLKRSEFSRDIISSENGYISHVDTEAVGNVCVALGAGRLKKDDAIDNTAGIVFKKKKGSAVSEGDVIATLYCSDMSLLDNAEKLFIDSVTFSPFEPKSDPILISVVE